MRWHRSGFRLYWTLISKARKRVGRKKISKEVRDLIFQMIAENPTWGAPRIHGELFMLGFDLSETHHLALDETRPQRSPPRSAMAYISPQSS